MVDEGKGLASHTHVLWASLPTPPSMGVPSSVLLRQGIGPTLLSSVSGEGLGQLFCLLQGTRGEQVAMGGIFRSPSPPHGRQGVQGQFPHSYNRTAGSPVPPHHQQDQRYHGVQVRCRACYPLYCRQWEMRGKGDLSPLPILYDR